ncbi:ImcF-related family protein [Caballeronia sp. LZ025]|uniref:ImcF-related family protein n=1 Tax=Caballeronia TaxID=1827195 RepID=UPI001FD5CBBC|nr:MULTISPECIES: ImcF-related family protein [Caballeronia]MDR5736269.1 ImcF-related family protein [Caballeronia sp. LZ025]
MTDPKLTLQSLESTRSTPEPDLSSRIAIWGLPAVMLIIGVFAIGFVWIRGDSVGLPSGEPRMWAVITVLVSIVLLVVLHLFLLAAGTYAFAYRLFHKETGDKTKSSKPLKRDARLQRMFEELRVARGWSWRRRLRWLLLHGTDEYIEQVAPGLKQLGVVHVGESILVHASPDSIEATRWLNEIRRLRRHRPVDGIVHVARADANDSELPRTLSGITTALGWAAPVTFLHPVEARGGKPERFDAVGAFMPDASRGAASFAVATLPDMLHELEQRTADIGVRIISEKGWITCLISEYIGKHAERMVENLRGLTASNWLRAPLAGVMFAPVFPKAAVVPVPEVSEEQTQGEPAQTEQVDTIPITREQPPALLPVWQQIGASTSRYRGRRTRLYWPNLLAACVLITALLWSVLLVVSGIGNHVLVQDAQATVAAAQAATPGTPQALRAQLALQKQIETLEFRQQHGAPWYLRAGLSHNDELLDALWQPYQTVAAQNLRQPVVQALESQLTTLSQTRSDEQQSHDVQQRAYNRLKAYLMLANPTRADASFLKTQLMDLWPAPSDMRAGEWLDTSQQLMAFWTDHLKAHLAWRITASMPLVTQMRSMLVNQIGLAGSDDVLYERVLGSARGKYADVSLATLLAGADAHGLFTTTQTVPGIFTRAAWDGVIEKSIDDAAKQQHLEGDWVLTDDRPAGQPSVVAGAAGAVDAARTALDKKRDIDDLRKRLRTRYFTDYVSAWASMLNSLRWTQPTSFSGVIDQLTRMTDAQTSALIAIMKSVKYQGEAGREAHREPRRPFCWS